MAFAPFVTSFLFLSTPSARRATLAGTSTGSTPTDFYPRPPRGGRRRSTGASTMTRRFLSTPSARRATRRLRRPPGFVSISIHALREEGDALIPDDGLDVPISIHALREEGDMRFHVSDAFCRISIHALREEGDHGGIQRGIQNVEISIHALREEGDMARIQLLVVKDKFLSTPSARRATPVMLKTSPRPQISIHALREEGDRRTSSSATFTVGFLSTPSARRATG